MKQGQQVRPCSIERLTTNGHQFTRTQHHFRRLDVMYCQTIFQAVHTAGVFRNVTANRAGDLRRRVRRIKKAQARDRLGNIEIGHPRLDNSRHCRLVNTEYPVELRQHEQHTLTVRHGTPGKAGACAPRDNGYTMPVTEGNNLLHFFNRRRYDNQPRQLALGRQSVSFVDLETGVIADDVGTNRPDLSIKFNVIDCHRPLLYPFIPVRRHLQSDHYTQPFRYNRPLRQTGCTKVAISTVEDILDEFRLGNMVLIMDDEDRENEGDLIIAADVVTPEHITFFARHACGLICLTITEDRAKRLKLPLMADKNGSTYETNFTVSIEAAEGITTGISAADRAKTVHAATAKNATANDIVQPGHIFPIIAQPGGVLTRAGHTEAGCDLARMSGYEPAAVIVEVMNEDGTMAQRPQLEEFAEKHGIKVGTIADLIHYRNLYDTTIEMVDQKNVDTVYGRFNLRTYKDNISDSVHYALCAGEINETEPCLVRVQVVNTLRDVLNTTRPGFNDTWSLNDSMQRVAEEGKGVIVLVGQEFNLHEEMNQAIHFPQIPPAQRQVNESGGAYKLIGTGSQILKDVGVGKMRLLSSPIRYHAISGFDLEVVEFVEKGE